MSEGHGWHVGVSAEYIHLEPSQFKRKEAVLSVHNTHVGVFVCKNQERR